jgi:hypothetical protein
MKLSEAISLGAMLTPQAIGRFIDAQGCRCAWASAFNAAGQTTTTAIYMYEEWKWTKQVVDCPVCRATGPVTYMIVHLNDRHQWTRQRIADWVSTIEPTEQTPSEGEEFSYAV